MSAEDPSPADLVADVRSATERPVATVDPLREDQLAEPSRLPGWTRIRAVRPDEHAAVGDLLVSSYDNIESAQIDPDYNHEMRDVDARTAHSEVLVAVDNAGRVVGTITYLPRPGPLSQLAGPHEGEFRMFAVADTARGQGIGRQLVETCLGRARRQQLRRVWLSTSPWMTDAQHLYTKLGFQRVTARDHTEVSSGQAFELLAYMREI